MARFVLGLALFAALGFAAPPQPHRPPRPGKAAAWATAARTRLTEARENLRDARQDHRATLEGTHAAGSHRKPR